MPTTSWRCVCVEPEGVSVETETVKCYECEERDLERRRMRLLQSRQELCQHPLRSR